MDKQPQDSQQSSSGSVIDQPAAASSTTESIKQQAIEALIPLLDSIDGPPEKKFEILMTAMRSAGDQNVLQKALQAALAIEEPAAKAEALLDVINEASFQEDNQ